MAPERDEWRDSLTALHAAAYGADVEGVREALRAGNSPNAQDRHGYTPLWWCCFRGRVGEQLPVALALLDAGADPDATPEAAADTPLTAAIQSGNADLVELLISRGASPNQPTPQGVTPLMSAGRVGSERMVQVLLEHGASRDDRCHGYSAEDYAREYGHPGVASLIHEWSMRA